MGRRRHFSHPLWGDPGWLLPGPFGALRPLALWLRPALSGKNAASIELALPSGLEALIPYRVVDGSFLTRLCARIDDSMGFS